MGRAEARFGAEHLRQTPRQHGRPKRAARRRNSRQPVLCTAQLQAVVNINPRRKHSFGGLSFLLYALKNATATAPGPACVPMTLPIISAGSSLR